MGTAPNEPPLYVKLPDVNTKLVEGFIVPLVKSNAGPLMVNVVQVIVPILTNVPLVYVAVLEQVKLNPPKSMVPAVIVKVVHSAASDNVVVPTPLLIVNGAIVFPLEMILPVPLIVAVNEVYVPLLDNVNPFKLSDVVPGLNEVVPKSNVLNQLPVVSVAILAPVVNVRLGALDVVPSVWPQVNVFVAAILATVNPPVPVRVNPVRVAILNTVVPAVCATGADRSILAVPKVIARVLLVFELNIHAVRVNPFKLSVP